MNRLIATLVLGVLLISAAPMKARGADADVAREQVQEVVDRLALTDEQVEQVEPVLEKAAAKRDRILSKYGVDPDNRGSGQKPKLRTMRSMKKEMDSLRKATTKQLKGILTAEQLSEYEQIQQERQDAMRQRIRG